MSDGFGRRPNRRQVGVGRYGHSNSHIDQDMGSEEQDFHIEILSQIPLDS